MPNVFISYELHWEKEMVGSNIFFVNIVFSVEKLGELLLDSTKVKSEEKNQAY